MTEYGPFTSTYWCYIVIQLHTLLRHNSRADAGICEKWPVPPVPFISGWSPLILSLSPLLPPPSEIGPLKPARESAWGSAVRFPDWGLERSHGRKRIWCTLKLSETHWWQSFWICWLPCFTVERSKFSIANMTISEGVCPSPKGGPEPARPPSKSATANG